MIQSISYRKCERKIARASVSKSAKPGVVSRIFRKCKDRSALRHCIARYCTFNYEEQFRKLAYRNSALLPAHTIPALLNARISPVAISRQHYEYNGVCVAKRSEIHTNKRDLSQGWCRKKRLVWNKFNSSAVTRPDRFVQFVDCSPRIRAGIMRLRGHSSK